MRFSYLKRAAEIDCRLNQPSSAPSQSPFASTGLWLAAIFLAGLLVRVLHFACISPTAFVEFPLHATETDLHSFWQWSGQIAHGDWLGEETHHPYHNWMAALADLETWHRWWGGEEIFQQEPLYPYALGFARVLGLSLPGIILAQLLVGAIFPVLIFLLSKRLLLEDGAALCAAGITAFYGPMVFYQGAILRDWLVPLVETTALVLLLRALDTKQTTAWILAGLAFGFALLTKSTILIFLPVMFAWAYWVNRNDTHNPTRIVLLIGSGVTLGFAPLVARNLLVGAPALAITNRGPEAILNANAADASPIGLSIPESLPFLMEQAQGSAIRALMASIGSYEGNWKALLNMQLEKLRAVLAPFEVPNNLSYTYGQEISAMLRLLPDFGWVLPLALLGILLIGIQRRIDHRHGLLLLHGLTVLSGLVLTTILGRYRLALTPVMMVYGGWALWQAYRWTVTRRFKQLGIAAFCLGIIIIVQHVLLPTHLQRNNVFMGVHPLSYGTASTIYLARGEVDAALDEWIRMRQRASALGLEGGVELAVRNEQEIYRLLALALARSGALQPAASALRKAEALYQWREDAYMRDFEVGMAFADLNMVEEAVPRLRRFVADYPDQSAAVHAQLALDRLEEEMRSSDSHPTHEE